jgi:hypothetical protein
MENINFVNKSAVIETGRDPLLNVDDLALNIAKMIVSGEHMKEHQGVIRNKELLLKSLLPLKDLQDAFYKSLGKMNEQSKALEDSTKKATGKAKDSAHKLNDAILKLDKILSIPTLEKKVELLERAADAMEKLNALQQTGKLDKILQSLK